MLDTLVHVETPEGVELALPVAGPVSRAQAFVIDAVAKTGAWWLVATVAAPFGETGVGLLLIFAFLLSWLYPVFFEVLNGGATPGKRVVGLRVVHDDGTPVGWPASLIRSIVGFVDWLPGLYAIGLLASLTQPGFKRLGDLAAGTVVLHVDRRKPADLTSEVRPAPPPVALLPAEQRAIVEFAERAGQLTPERREELAEIVGALTRAGVDPAAQLVAQARWIAGQR